MRRPASAVALTLSLLAACSSGSDDPAHTEPASDNPPVSRSSDAGSQENVVERPEDLVAATSARQLARTLARGGARVARSGNRRRRRTRARVGTAARVPHRGQPPRLGTRGSRRAPRRRATSGRVDDRGGPLARAPRRAAGGAPRLAHQATSSTRRADHLLPRGRGGLGCAMAVPGRDPLRRDPHGTHPGDVDRGHAGPDAVHPCDLGGVRRG